MGISLGVDIVEVPPGGTAGEKCALCGPGFYGARSGLLPGQKKRRAQHFAVRFAAKEAVYKALGKPGVAHKEICRQE
jgi:phosphopantetheinyl transferase (holo-ACP synthase)